MILLASTNLTIILSAIIVFLVVISLLVVILLYAKKMLTPQGEVTLTINEEKELHVEPGSTLLTTLSNNGIFLPSACGGGGTCAMCKCQVIEGGGSILQTEVGYFTRKEQMENWRLGCQVKIREDIKVKVPEEVMGIKKWECEVISNDNVSTLIKELVVKLPEGEKLDFQSGGYIQIDVPKAEVDFSKDIEIEKRFTDDWDKLKLWDLHMKSTEDVFRAYSMANHPAEDNMVILNIRIAIPPWNKTNTEFLKVNPGICSSYLFSRKPGDKVTLSGPYGDFFIKDTDNEIMFIAKGAGMAPMRSHIFHLFQTVKTTRKVSFWYGARSKRDILYNDQFRQFEKDFPNFTFHPVLTRPRPEDKWEGYTGTIHQAILDNYLSNHEAPEDVEYYLCSSPEVSEGVLKMLYDLGVSDDMIAYDDFG